jgi:SWI/SNF-related matrix-associated actin-dependent regulator 1 of chromatin subfamily A
MYGQKYYELSLADQQRVAKDLGLASRNEGDFDDDSEQEVNYSDDNSTSGSAKKRRKPNRPVNSCEKRKTRKAMGEETIKYHLRRVPYFLRESLLPFQRAGVAFGVSKEGKCLIADEMGLGKTIQGIAVAAAYKDDWPLLVVVPAAVKFNWADELERWLPQLAPGAITVIKNGNDIDALLKTEVTVLTFSLLTRTSKVAEKLSKLSKQVGVVIVDESHSIKNLQAQR